MIATAQSKELLEQLLNDGRATSQALARMCDTAEGFFNAIAEQAPMPGVDTPTFEPVYMVPGIPVLDAPASTLMSRTSAQAGYLNWPAPAPDVEPLPLVGAPTLHDPTIVTVTRWADQPGQFDEAAQVELAGLAPQTSLLAHRDAQAHPRPAHVAAPTSFLPPVAAPPPFLPPVAAPAPKDPWHQREGMLSKVMAFVGAGVLLIGVALLLILAARAGWFGPVPRTVGGGLLAIALLVSGIRIHANSPRNPGALALAASGFAAGYLDVVAASAIYNWIPIPVALCIGFALALAGLWLSRGWGKESMAVIVVGGALLLVPALGTDIRATVIFMVTLTVATASLRVNRLWTVLSLVRTVPTVAVTTLASLNVSIRPAETPVLIAAGAALLLASLHECRLQSLPGDVSETTWLTSEVRQHVSVATLPVMSLPLAACGVMADRTPGAIVLFAAGTGLVVLSVLPAIFNRIVRTTAGALGTVAVLLGFMRLLDSSSLLTVGLGVAFVTMLAGLVARDMASTIRGAVIGVLGGALWLPSALMVVLAWDGASVAVMASSALVAACCTVAIVALDRWSSVGATATLSLASLALGALSVTTISLTSLIGTAGGSTADGFRAGHALVTVAWIAIAGRLLLRPGRLLDQRIQKRYALGLGSVALAKLFLYDMSALPGMARIGAFIACGVLLMVLAARYARAERSQR